MKLYTIYVTQINRGMIHFETLEEAKEWSEMREGDVHWYNNEEDPLRLCVGSEDIDISKEVDWL